MVTLIERELLSIMGIITNPKIFKMRITMDAFRVYSCICNFIENGFEDDDLPKYHCRASYKRIIEKCFRDTYPEASESHLKNKAIDAVNELCDLQVIEKILIKDVNGSHKENVYRLRPDSDWCVDANPTKERYRFNVHGRNSRSLTPVSSNHDSNTITSTQETIMQSNKPSKLTIKGYDDIEDVPDVFVFDEDIPTSPVFDYTGLDEDSDEYLEILQQEVEYNQRRFKAYAKWAKSYQKAKDARENKNRIEKSPLNPRNFIPNIDELYANAPSELDQQIDEKIFEGGSLPSKPGVVYGINQVDEKINTGSKLEEKNAGNVDDSKVLDINNVYSQNLTISLENGCNDYIESNTVNGNKNESNSVCYNSSSLNSINNINKISNKEEDYYRKVEILSSPDKKKYYFDLECQELLIELYTRHKPKNWFSIEKGIPAYQKRQLNEILREENFNGNAGELLQRLESGLKYAKQDEYWNNNQGGLHSLLYHSNFEIWAGMYDHEQSKAVVSQIDTAKTMNISDLDRDVYKFDYPEFINQIKKGELMNQEPEDEERHLTAEELAEMNERKKAKEWVRSLRINTLAVIHQREQEQIELERNKKYNPELEYEKTRETEKINPMYSKKFTGTKIENGMFTEEYVNFLENSQYIKDDEDDEEKYDDF